MALHLGLNADIMLPAKYVHMSAVSSGDLAVECAGVYHGVMQPPPVFGYIQMK